MALRDIFKFRDLPDSETSKPFLEHLEDLRWTIVKMALTLGAAMIVCFAFRSALVRILQAPLRDVGSQIGTLKALGITDSIVISFHLAFYAGIVLSFPLQFANQRRAEDRKSTRLNSSHQIISYAVFCLKKKKK